MAKLIVNGVCRYTLHFTLGGESQSNVFDIRIDTTGEVTDRHDAIIDQADVIWNTWASEMLPLQVDNMTMDRLTWVDLDDAEGETGEITGTGTNPQPQVGGDSGAPLPSNTAGLVKKSVSGSRGTRSGLLYLGGLSETRTTDGASNQLAGADVAVINAALANLLDDIEQNTGFDDPQYTSRWVVVHITDRDEKGRPIAGTSANVASLTVRARLSTQRRRMNGR